MLTIEAAREWLRIDGADNDEIIRPLLDAIPSYIETATGMTAERQALEPLAATAGKFLLQLWYNAEQADAPKLERTIDSLLKSLGRMAMKG
jgi:hypothetical protein